MGVSNAPVGVGGNQWSMKMQLVKKLTFHFACKQGRKMSEHFITVMGVII